MSEPTPIDPLRLLEFIEAPGLTVVLVSVHPAHAFSQALRKRLRENHGDGVAFGTVDLARLFASGSAALPYLHEALRAHRGSSSFGILPGYWLFRAGELLAWDSGLPTFDDVKGLAQSALLGAFFSGLSRDRSFGGQALRVAMEERAATRIAHLFREAAARPREQRRPPSRTSPPSPSEVLWAYQTLGVLPSVSDREVQQAWRKRRIENHPDSAAHDPVEFQRLSRISSDINRARDIILRHRGREKRAAV
jgi:hypothetical protein